MIKPRILVVEDNLMLQKLCILLAKRNHLDIDVAGSCQEALAYCQSGNYYSMVFMDWSLPDQNGLCCTQSIRALGGRHLPIIAMTANMMPGDREQCLDAGMDDFLGKPFTSNEFANMVNRWLDPESIWQSADICPIEQEKREPPRAV